ncbi:tRNA pseudouridine(13) synthase TruD [bacterium]|nr:tRNA pseudouridine(13) synthase TruD [bacterium]
MKIKSRPEDFVVEEVIDLPLVKGQAEYSVYRLTKRGANTLDVISDIARRFHLRRRDISYAGLKDRHALTTQFISIRGGGLWKIRAKNYELEFIGRAHRPVGQSVLLGNRFRVVVRGISADKRRIAQQRLPQIAQFGFVNYYDSQRFSSARHGKGFVAHRIILGDYEGAARLLFESSARDNSAERRFRRCVLSHWGDWLACVHLAPSRWERKFLEKLVRSSNNFRRALELVDRDFLFLLGTAYQAFLWNLAAKEFLRRHLPPERRFCHRFWRDQTLIFLRDPDGETLSELGEVRIPLPSPGICLRDEIGEIYDEILRRQEIDGMEKFRTKIPGMVFKTALRDLIVVPQDFDFIWRDDATLEVACFLPKGSYITMLLRQAFAPPGRKS